MNRGRRGRGDGWRGRGGRGRGGRGRGRGGRGRQEDWDEKRDRDLKKGMQGQEGNDLRMERTKVRPLFAQQVAKKDQSREQRANDVETEIRMDSDGNLLGKDGKVIEVTKREKIGKKRKRSHGKKIKLLEIDEQVKKPRSLVFHEHGKFIRIQEKREKTLKFLDAIKSLSQDELYQEVGTTQMMLGHPTRVDGVEDEWWNKKLYDENGNVLLKNIKHSFVEHSKKISGIQERKPSGPIPLYLTEKEAKRIKKQKKRERFEEERLKIQLGLLPPPKPKSNLTHFLRTHLDSTANPTEINAQIKQDIQDRKDEHAERMAKLKVSKEERLSKNEKKANLDAEGRIHCAVIKINHIPHKKNRSKISKQAKQNWIHGCCFVMEQDKFSIVIAEAGPIHLKRFCKVIGKIKWEEENGASEMLFYGRHDKWEYVEGFYWNFMSQLVEFYHQLKRLGWRHYFNLCYHNYLDNGVNVSENENSSLTINASLTQTQTNLQGI